MTRWLTISLVLLGGVMVGCTPKGNGGRKGDGPDPEKPATNAKPDFTLDFGALFEEMKVDQKAADAKYNGKVIELTGKVWQVSGKGGTWLNNISLGGEKRGEPLEEILCRIDPAYVEKTLRLSVGQKIKATGKFLKGIHGTLLDCTIAELEPSKIRIATAEQLAKECETDPKAGEKYSRNENMIVVGTFEKASKIDLKQEGGGYYAKLKGTDKTGVSIAVGYDEFKEITKLKKGVTVEMRAWYTSPKLEMNELQMDGGTLIKVK